MREDSLQEREHYLKEYGPSNYHEIPRGKLGAILKTVKTTTPGKHDGEKGWAMVDDPILVMRGQAESAIKNGEHSPDALWGVWDKISTEAKKISQNNPEVKKWLEGYRNLIEDGIQRYGTLSPEVVKKFVEELKSHPRLLSGDPEQQSKIYLDHLENFYDSEQKDALKKNADILDTISYMLKLVAEYEDGKERGKY
ncbi:MAG: hypothetical protein A3D44_02675 [Candidatus Staskawiczbacteria bacterium RIFCSPHIGHO2_02_FULL_42_22]|uniref:Uncharacterized protein n=1 Tax=Candidatus Staskawiczbacteria bacterium RIFCSPHIGHO2_02_FULL_42_22 TaxID=1802207 RepID=A0A1G2I4J9_9BACT|nr:MAG: hypothetical protein A3D44_02675 [Candidatus Staskawiczbacteria bacterium RIFCSPHIGHO2_02_FULL_42_22]